MKRCRAVFRVMSWIQCFCSGALDDPTELGESDSCTFECSGDSTETCGGRGAISVYSYVHFPYVAKQCYTDDKNDRVLTGYSVRKAEDMDAEVKMLMIYVDLRI